MSHLTILTVLICICFGIFIGFFLDWIHTPLFDFIKQVYDSLKVSKNKDEKDSLRKTDSGETS